MGARQQLTYGLAAASLAPVGVALLLLTAGGLEHGGAVTENAATFLFRFAPFAYPLLLVGLNWFVRHVPIRNRPLGYAVAAFAAFVNLLLLGMSWIVYAVRGATGGPLGVREMFLLLGTVAIASIGLVGVPFLIVVVKRSASR
jgi:hypothetical protein